MASRSDLRAVPEFAEPEDFEDDIQTHAREAAPLVRLEARGYRGTLLEEGEEIRFRMKKGGVGVGYVGGNLKWETIGVLTFPENLSGREILWARNAPKAGRINDQCGLAQDWRAITGMTPPIVATPKLPWPKSMRTFSDAEKKPEGRRAKAFFGQCAVGVELVATTRIVREYRKGVKTVDPKTGEVTVTYETRERPESEWYSRIDVITGVWSGTPLVCSEEDL